MDTSTPRIRFYMHELVGTLVGMDEGDAHTRFILFTEQMKIRLGQITTPKIPALALCKHHFKRELNACSLIKHHCAIKLALFPKLVKAEVNDCQLPVSKETKCLPTETISALFCYR